MKEKYIAKREELMTEAQNFINEGKIQEFEAKKIEVEQLDADYEIACQKQAEFDALNQNNKVTKIENTSVKVDGAIMERMNGMNMVEEVEFTNSVGYRKSFMNYVRNGQINREFINADNNTLTSDVSVVIPQVVLDQIVCRIQDSELLKAITNTNYKTGVAVAVNQVKPQATWTAEGASSDKQKATVGQIVFGAFKLRVAISMSLEVSELSLQAFEAMLTAQIAEALQKALEEAVVKGTGVGMPKGLTQETPVETVTLDAVNRLTYDKVCEIEGCIKSEYDKDSIYIMNKKTFFNMLDVQENGGQVVASMHTDVDGKVKRFIFGRPVVFTNFLPASTDANPDDLPVAIVCNAKDYVLNTSYQLVTKHYEDNDTDDQIIKSVLLADGKMLTNDSLIFVEGN